MIISGDADKTAGTMSGALEVGLRILDPRLPAWGFPHWGSALAAGLDLHACLDASAVLEPGGPPLMIPAGFALVIGDPGWCGLIAPRSGLGHRGLVLGNTIGILDADYEGPVLLSAWNRNPAGAAGDAITISPGDRIAQLVFVRIERPRLGVVPSAGGSARGEGGFGSTGIAPAGTPA